MYNVLKNSIKPNLHQRAAIALSRADQLTAAREYRLHSQVLYLKRVLDAAWRYLVQNFNVVVYVTNCLHSVPELLIGPDHYTLPTSPPLGGLATELINI